MRVTCGTTDNPLTSDQDSIEFQNTRGQANFVIKSKAGKLPNILLQSSGTEVRETEPYEPPIINILNQKIDGAQVTSQDSLDHAISSNETSKGNIFLTY